MGRKRGGRGWEGGERTTAGVGANTRTNRTAAAAPPAPPRCPNGTAMAAPSGYPSPPRCARRPSPPFFVAVPSRWAGGCAHAARPGEGKMGDLPAAVQDATVSWRDGETRSDWGGGRWHRAVVRSGCGPGRDGQGPWPGIEAVCPHPGYFPLADWPPRFFPCLPCRCHRPTCYPRLLCRPTPRPPPPPHYRRPTTSVRWTRAPTVLSTSPRPSRWELASRRGGRPCHSCGGAASSTGRRGRRVGYSWRSARRWWRPRTSSGGRTPRGADAPPPAASVVVPGR